MPKRLSKNPSPEEIRETIGNWLTHCRLGRRLPGEPIPPDVQRAYSLFPRIRDLSKETLQANAKEARKARLKEHAYESATDRLRNFNRELIPAGGRLVERKVTTQRKTKNSWPVIFLELPAQIEGHVLRYKATRNGFFHTLVRTRRGRRGADDPATFAWRKIAPDVLPSLHPAVSAFFMALRPPPQ